MKELERLFLESTERIDELRQLFNREKELRQEVMETATRDSKAYKQKLDEKTTLLQSVIKQRDDARQEVISLKHKEQREQGQDDEKLTVLMNENNDLKAKNRELQTIIDELNEELSDQDDTIDNLTDSNKELQQHIELLHKEINDHKLENKKLKNEKEVVKTVYSGKDFHIVKNLIDSFENVKERNYLTSNHMNKWNIGYFDLARACKVLGLGNTKKGNCGELVTVFTRDDKILNAKQLQEVFENYLK